MNEYQDFSTAASYVDRYWTQGGYEGPEGRCLVGAVGGAKGILNRDDVGIKLEKETTAKIHAQLKKHWDYHVARVGILPLWFVAEILGRIRGEGSLRERLPWRQAGIEIWNDLPWRKQEQVVAVLNAIAASERPAWLEDEVLRLSIEISSLREQISDLRTKLALAEAENQRLWRRTLGISQLAVDRRQLEWLEVELAESAERMKELELERA